MPTDLPIAPPLTRRSLPYWRRHPNLPRPAPTWRWAARRRRSLFVLLVLAQTLLATHYMVGILPYHASTWLEKALVATFVLNFAWISIGTWLAVFGFGYRLIGGDKRRLACQVDKHAQLAGRCALIMPIYHESVDACFAGLAATYRDIEQQGLIDQFDFYVLSDSRNPDVWLAEQQALCEWRERLGAHTRLFYRRRRVNLRHKSGNVADFLRRWGANYDYFVVLDADSIMAADTLAQMVRIMDANPRVGIVQAPPSIVAASSLFARLQQFANHLYGPLFSTGLAALQLGDGAYWGHNAIIRTQAFMAHCALPSLRGVGLFKGPILSHDFVEATYMRRGGYEVWLETDLAGSYEQSPPSLVDELTRDRRWARGNLQHLPIMLAEKGLKIPQRFIFLNGILAYAAAPLWLLFLILAGLEVAQFTLFPINYFPESHQLFPLWPQWHPEWAIALAFSTVCVLFVPKWLAFLDAACRHQRRHGFGGFWRLLASGVLEIVASILLAPVRMLSHSRFVAEALPGLELTWAGQHRSGAIGWQRALLMHGAGLLIGLAWAIFAWWLKPLYFYWSLPISVPLMLAPAVAVLTSHAGVGRWFATRGWLATPAQTTPPPVVSDWQALMASQPDRSGEALNDSLTQPQQLALACRFARHPGRLSAEQLEAVRDAGLQALSARERSLLADDAQALRWLHEQLRQQTP